MVYFDQRTSFTSKEGIVTHGTDYSPKEANGSHNFSSRVFLEEYRSRPSGKEIGDVKCRRIPALNRLGQLEIQRGETDPRREVKDNLRIGPW